MPNKDQITIENVNYSLEDLDKDTWNRLFIGATKSRNPFHTPCVATMDKGEVSLRTVVLRKALAKERELRFHTDIRSPKWKELSLSPSISALFYDAGDRIQLRVKGQAALQYKNDLTAEAWKNTSSSSRRCYLTHHSPSSFAKIPTSGLSEDIEQENFTFAESEMGYSNFGIVSIQVQSIDWLWLNQALNTKTFSKLA
jgi:3-hydroxyisobutyrate dehydrogenase